MKRCGRRCHRFRHPRAHTTPHHSIIHTPKMIVYLAPNKFQFSKGSPPPTLHSSQIRSSTRTNDSAQLDHPPTANTSPPSSTRQISKFLISKGSPPPTQSWSQIPLSTRTNDSAQLDHPPTANTSPPSSTRQNSNFNFLRGHRLPPIDYARPRRQQSPISTIHLANLRRPLPHLG